MKFKEFEDNGLKIDNERVLTYSKLSCPLECTYCFVDEMTQEQSREAAYLTEKQFGLLENLPEQVKLIMLGCDTEFFQNKQQALDILERLSDLGKDISVITKIPLSKDFLGHLVSIHKKLKENGKVFSFSISLPCLSEVSVRKYEPHVPSPDRRIETLENAFSLGIPTTLAIRPLLPDITDEELREIVERTKNSCFGYYSGPLYLQEQKINLLLPNHKVPNLDPQQPHWMLDGNRYHSIEKEGQIEFLKDLVRRSGRMFFDGAADAVEYLRRENRYEKP